MSRRMPGGLRCETKEMLKMKVYAGSDVRNVAIVGHAHSGKTELISAILKTAKSPAASSRENGGAVTQYDEEEIARKMTMSNAVAYAEWDGIKVNMIDTPGFHMFLHEARAAMLPAETALVVVNAQTGVESGTDRVWNYAAEIGLPRIVVMNQVDHPKADSRTGRMEMLEGIRERWGRQVVPVQLPIVDEQGISWRRRPGDDGGVICTRRMAMGAERRARFRTRWNPTQRPRMRR